MSNQNIIKFAIISQDSHFRMFQRAATGIPYISAKLFSDKKLEASDEEMQKALNSIGNADVVLLCRSAETAMETVEEELKSFGKAKNVISIGNDPSLWLPSTVKSGIVAKCSLYATYGGLENYKNMLHHVIFELYNIGEEPPPPAERPYEGIYHPSGDAVFKEKKEYMSWYKNRGAFKNFAGILFSRHYWLNENTEMIDALIADFENAGVGVLPVFMYSAKDQKLNSLSRNEVIEKYFLKHDKTSEINALVKLTSLFGNDAVDHNSNNASREANIFLTLGVPVFQPVLNTYKTQSEWENDAHGLGAATGWYVTLPEFEGVIEPLMLAVAAEEGNDTSKVVPVTDRSRKITGRVAKWIQLQQKPPHDRKIAFILHNDPCASVEASVGAAANLDALESLARIIKRMSKAGYNTQAPQTGEELIKEIMDKKAVSEFRWTSVNEIVKKGGCLKLLTESEYRQWFDTFPEKLKQRVIAVWGEPPAGKEKNGAPPAMVYDNKIVVSGLQYGNVVVCVQPKRGCAGARCDGTVCKILHDPDLPPPHQYFATYRYLEHGFGADCIVHIGTHGNLEFLPGKGVGLSSDCSPDAAIGTLPHIYIYNADNPSEGSTAKRRSYATLIDHIQVLMVRGGLTKPMEELEQLLSEYVQTWHAASLPQTLPRAHQLQHLIEEALTITNIAAEINYEHGKKPFDEVVREAHEVIALVKNSQINKGLHIFGNIPEGDDRIKYIAAIFRADTENGLELRSTIFKLTGLSLDETLQKPSDYHPEWGMTLGQIAEKIDDISIQFIQSVIDGNEPVSKIVELLGDKIKNRSELEKFNLLAATAKDINRRMEQSDELGALLHGLDGKYIRTGPSGKITRGEYEVLPCGKNFYTLDVRRLPTMAAYLTGYSLAAAVIKKHQKEEGRLPENVAIYWNVMDISCCNGEGMAQIMAFMGVHPRWSSSGTVTGFDILSLKELGRPRIDVTIRIGGILRDSFPECMYYIDEIIRFVAALDEPPEMNYVRKHSLEKMKNDARHCGLDPQSTANNWEAATTRIFGARPGTFRSGVNFAVYASEWKDEKDLADIFVEWNKYGYGKNIYGKEMPDSLTGSLKSVDITFNKTYTDEYDLISCCGHFGTHGGITATARNVSGKQVKAYYGDTRDTKNVGVRDLANEVRRVVRSKVLNPQWIDGMKKHGYKGLGDISKRIGRVYGWEATTGEVDDWIFDDIARTYINDNEMRAEFEKNNPWALEEIGRRLLEAAQRGIWNANEKVLDDLKNNYLEIEGWIEEKMGEVEGDIQGGTVGR